MPWMWSVLRACNGRVASRYRAHVVGWMDEDLQTALAGGDGDHLEASRAFVDVHGIGLFTRQRRHATPDVTGQSQQLLESDGLHSLLLRGAGHRLQIQ